jgi:hypothetical protein
LFGGAVEHDVVSRSRDFADGESVSAGDILRQGDSLVAWVVQFGQPVGRKYRAIRGVHWAARGVSPPVARAQYDGHFKRQIRLDGTDRCGIERVGDSTACDASTARLGHEKLWAGGQRRPSPETSRATLGRGQKNMGAERWPGKKPAGQSSEGAEPL